MIWKKPVRGFRLYLLRNSSVSGVILRLDLLDKTHADAAGDWATWTPLEVPEGPTVRLAIFDAGGGSR